MMQFPALSVRNLRVEIPTRAGMITAVRDVSFDVPRGEVFCLVGESGCGKSMTSLAIMDLLPKGAQRFADALLFRNEDLVRLPKRRMNALRGSRISMIFQEPMTALNPCYTIGDQLMETYLRHKSAGRAEAKEKALYLLDKVGITRAASRLGQYPHQFSGGMRQRVMIAMALMCDPELLIADEPTTALDVTVQAQILRLLRRLQVEMSIAIVLVTHDLGVVAQMANRVGVMYAGEIVEQGSVAEVFAAPRHPYTQGLFACMPAIESDPDDPLGSIPGTVPSLMDIDAGCAFRNRCTFAQVKCSRPLPERRDGTHVWRCVLSDDCPQ
jgi:peptide/nickel transport system ATP-binding protein